MGGAPAGLATVAGSETSAGGLAAGGSGKMPLPATAGVPRRAGWLGREFAVLERAGEAQCRLQHHRVLHLHIQTRWFLQTYREQLYLLVLGEVAGARKKVEESFGIVIHYGRPSTRRQLAQRCQAQGRTVAHVEQLREAMPCRRPMVTLEASVPLLHAIEQMV